MVVKIYYPCIDPWVVCTGTPGSSTHKPWHDKHLVSTIIFYFFICRFVKFIVSYFCRPFFLLYTFLCVPARIHILPNPLLGQQWSVLRVVGKCWVSIENTNKNCPPINFCPKRSPRVPVAGILRNFLHLDHLSSTLLCNIFLLSG